MLILESDCGSQSSSIVFVRLLLVDVVTVL